MEPDASAAASGREMSICRGCGTSNKSSAKFCRQCGAALGSDAAPPRVSETPVDDIQARAQAPPSPAGKPETNLTRDADPSERERSGQVGGPAPTSEAPAQVAVRPAAQGVRPGLALGVGAAVIVVVGAAVLFMTSRHTNDESPATATTRPGPALEARGTLRVEVNVPGRATLDGWHLPDAGAQAASLLVFINVEATTHTLEVWSEGYRRDSSSVAVRADQTSRVAVNLQRVQ